MDWTVLKDLAILVAGLFLSRFIKLGDAQSSAAVQQATFGTRLAAAEEWIKNNSDIQSIVRELKKDIETLNGGVNRLEDALRSVAQSFGGHRYAAPPPDAPPALSPDIMAGLAMLSRLGKNAH